MSKADGYKYEGNWLDNEEHGAGKIEPPLSSLRSR